jgi:hypothetical protein
MTRWSAPAAIDLGVCRVVALVIVAGCTTEHRSLPTNQGEDLAHQVQAAELRMHDRYAWAREIQREIAQGDLALAQSSARVITRLEEPYALAAWQPYLVSVHDAAHQIELAASADAAAQATGLLGRRCAECHEAIHAKVALQVRAEPPNSPKLAPQMLGHQWAAAEMWDGLIGPAPERWLRGANALTRVPLTLVAQAVTPTSPESVDDVSRIRIVARRAATATTTADRAQVFGELLGACVHCHEQLRDR